MSKDGKNFAAQAFKPKGLTAGQIHDSWPPVDKIGLLSLPWRSLFELSGQFRKSFPKS